MPTPHISAAAGEIAPLVVMPGDPKRAERIAKEYFDSPKLVSDVRGIGAWVGKWQGYDVTAMASGMGIPSLSIYATELFRFYGVERICRVGTCGGVAKGLHLKDVVVAASAHTNSRVAELVPGATLSLAASVDMLIPAVVKAKELTAGMEQQVKTGAVYSSDFFYREGEELMNGLVHFGTLGVEMEAAGLYACAATEGKQALAVCTVSDLLFEHTEKDLTSEERETTFDTALQIALAALTA